MNINENVCTINDSTSKFTYSNAFIINNINTNTNIYDIRKINNDNNNINYNDNINTKNRNSSFNTTNYKKYNKLEDFI